MKTKYKILKSQYSYVGYFVQTKENFFSFWRYSKDPQGFIILFSTAMEAEDYIDNIIEEKLKNEAARTN